MPYAAIQTHHEEMETSGVQFNQWQYALLKAPCKNPAGCCYGFCCTPCFAYQQRERILKNLSIPYQPCGGSFCCCPTPEINNSPMRECALCCEACCCPYVATLANRDLIMYHYQVDFDACDEYIITFVICLDCICSILAIIDDSFRDLRDLVDLLVLIIMSCSLAQQESTLDVVTGEPTMFGGKFKGEVKQILPYGVEPVPKSNQEPPTYQQQYGFAWLISLDSRLQRFRTSGLGFHPNSVAQNPRVLIYLSIYIDLVVPLVVKDVRMTSNNNIFFNFQNICALI